MNAITPFQFEGEPVRVVEIDGEPWFVGKDVAERLGYADPTNAMKQHCKGVVKRHPLQTAGGTQEIRLLGEPDVLRLIVKSNLPAAERFERWVFEDVLPTIRRTGSYSTRPAPAINVRDPAQLVLIATQLVEVNRELTERCEVAERAAADAAPKAAFYDRFAEADGLYGLQNAARALGQPPNTFINDLKRDCLFYQGNKLVPRSHLAGRGYFVVKPIMANDKARHQTFVTAKGLQWLAGRLGVPVPAPLATTADQASGPLH